MTSRNGSEGSEQHDRIIRASEVGQYAYCAHAWWLARVENLPSAHLEVMDASKEVHRRHGRGVRTSLTLRRLGYALLIAALVLVIITVTS
jgi:hypothetical protein